MSGIYINNTPADKDECAAGTHVCDENALCTNTDGGYTCVCNNGYIGDGIDCEKGIQVIKSCAWY